jgi:hypothetical protein
MPPPPLFSLDPNSPVEREKEREKKKWGADLEVDERVCNYYYYAGVIQ